MVPIFIDTSSITAEFPMMERDIKNLMDSVIKDVTRSFARKWQDEALRSLGGSRSEYAKNIIVIDEGFAKGAVVLLGWLPNAIESGVGPFDMKIGMLNGPNAKQGVNGKYNTIPFRLGNPEALNESALFSQVLPDAVYDVIQSKPQNIPSGGGVKTQGLKVSEIPSDFKEPVVRAAPSTPNKVSMKDYQHKFSVYAGVSKIKDPVTKQNRYVSFRRVSENSDPESWIYPGLTARNLAETALSNMNLEHTVGSALDSFLTSKGYI